MFTEYKKSVLSVKSVFVKTCFLREVLELAPDHLVDYAHIRLDNLHNLRADILFHVIRHRNTIVPILIHGHSRIHSLQQTLLIDTCNEETSLIQSFRTLGACTDANSREWVAYGGEEATFLWQRTAI